MNLVADLTGVLLDYWVLRASDDDSVKGRTLEQWVAGDAVTCETCGTSKLYFSQHPSREWMHAGPIVERERICVRFDGVFDDWRADKYSQDCHDALTSFPFSQHGPTPLIAAMRCYVASKFGDVVPIEAQAA